MALEPVLTRLDSHELIKGGDMDPPVGYPKAHRVEAAQQFAAQLNETVTRSW
jgi:hypothetical protein